MYKTSVFKVILHLRMIAFCLGYEDILTLSKFPEFALMIKCRHRPPLEAWTGKSSPINCGSGPPNPWYGDIYRL